MSEVEALILDAARFGAILGVGIGIVLALVLKEIADAFRESRQAREHDRQIRCMKDWKQTTEHL